VIWTAADFELWENLVLLDLWRAVEGTEFQMRYVANPIVVTGLAIVNFLPIESAAGELDLAGRSGLVLVLEDGSKFQATPSMLLGVQPHVPLAGDFLVTEPDGIVRIVPKSIFEKQYTRCGEN
jgi:hypothetical protein